MTDSVKILFKNILCFFCLVFAMPLWASVYMCLVVTCWERADLLALVCGVQLWVCYFPIGILGQVGYLIVSIPDLCALNYYYKKSKNICKKKGITKLNVRANLANISYTVKLICLHFANSLPCFKVKLRFSTNGPFVCHTLSSIFGRSPFKLLKYFLFRS